MTITGQVLPTLSYQQGRLLMDADARRRDIPSMRTITETVRVRGPFDETAFQHALAHVVSRHEALRTSFPNGVDEQIVWPEADAPVALHDLRGGTDPEADAQARVRQEAYTPFDPGQTPRIRATVLRLASDVRVVVVVLDHLTVDAWSRGIVLRELSSAYSELTAGLTPAASPPLLQYHRYVAESQSMLASAEFQHLLAFWRRTLHGIGAVPRLRSRRPAEPGAPACGHAGLRLTADMLGGARRLAAECRSTLFMFVLCALQLALARQTGDADQAVAVNVYNRDTVGTEALVAPMAELAVVRTDLTGVTTFRQALRLVRSTSLDAQDHAVPYGELVKALSPAEYARVDVPVGVVFNMQYAELLDDTLRFAGADCQTYPIFEEGFRPRSELLVVGRPDDEGLTIAVRHQADRLPAEWVTDLLAQLRNVVEAAVADPDAVLQPSPASRQATAASGAA
ncbi:condensation domain-containing protein [Micromonospora sp. RP3T]|uniref:condensation domain-containing protein n=1 Tax=Micromonospora sp. RP3T TaxID=2135446 RepID=UPI003D732CEF